MVFRHKTSRLVKYHDSRDRDQHLVLHEPTKDAEQKMKLWAQRRDAVLKRLELCGLKMFCFYSRDRDEIFCKIGADPHKLRITAARMRYKLKLKPEYFGAHAEYSHDYPGRPELNFADRRLVSHLYKTYVEDDAHAEDSIFSTVDKIKIINHIVSSKDVDCAGLNLGNLYHNGDIKEYFPLHEGQNLQDLAYRRLSWVWMHAEHANRVRNYFGDKVALYFLFMAFYWKWLLLPAVFGIMLQFLDVFFRTPDNMTAEPFCVFISVWCVMLPHFWRRQEAKYAVVWGTLDWAPELEPCRPEHWGDDQLNPVTGQIEPYYDWRRRVWHYAFSTVVIIGCSMSLLVLILILLFARHQLKSQVIGGIATFQFVLALTIEAVNALLSLISRYLTRRENHRTQSEHEMHLLTKVMCLKFMNSYFVLYYIGFFKKHSQLFGVRMNCIRNDCFLDLQAQLAIIFVVRLTVHNFIEFGAPSVSAWYRTMSSQSKAFVHKMSRGPRLELANMSSAEIESHKEQYRLFADFDETLITHGYATFFAVSSPWVLFATLLWVIIRMLLDMQRVTQNRKRPFPVSARSNEPWDTAFEVYGVLAALTNMALLVFTSEHYHDWKLYHKIMLFLFLAHTLFLTRLAVEVLFPDIPRSVEMMNFKQTLAAHRCLHNVKLENNHEEESWKGVTRLHRQHMWEHLTQDDFVVLESDVTEHEHDEDIEPRWHMMQSMVAFKEGILETLSFSCTVGMGAAFGVTTLSAIALLICNHWGIEIL